MEPLLKIVLIIVLSYLLGAFPSAVVISRRFFGFDIREKGSGNMGSTNAFRVLGWKWGIVVQVLDILKGVLAVAVIASLIGQGIDLGKHTWFEDLTLIKMLAGAAAVSGHIWSLFVGFRGGKGINTAAGMLIAIAPIDVSISIGIFIIAVIFSGYISLGSISAAIAFPSSMFFRYNILRDTIPGYEYMIYFALALTLVLLYAHRANIKRLLKGKENRFAKLHLIKCKHQQSKSV
jgi:glycerol-3-phosphate acyltransferase PlsY